MEEVEIMSLENGEESFVLDLEPFWGCFLQRWFSKGIPEIESKCRFLGSPPKLLLQEIQVGLRELHVNKPLRCFCGACLDDE